MAQFITNFSTVFVQVLILFILIGFGFAGNKAGIINKEGSKVMSDIVLYFVTPCLIINSFNIEFDKSKLQGLLICLIGFFLIMFASIIIVHLLFRGRNKQKNRVLRFAVVFSNAGYMGIPLQKAVLGDEGVFYGSVCVAVFNIMVWTYGLICMSGDKKSMSIKKLILNPGIIGVTVGLIVFLFSVSLPTPVSSVLESMAALNTPMAMMVIGFNLAGSNILAALKDKSVYIVSLLRLVVVPIASLFVLLLCGVRGSVLVSLVVAASAPVAAATSVFAIKYENDVNTSVNLVAFTTLLSIITMSAIVALAQMFQ